MPGRRKNTSVNTSAATSAVSSAMPSRAPSPSPRQPFRFFDLPSELRLRIYEEVLHVKKPLDLDPMNYRLIHPRLTIFLVSHRMYEEAYRVFYSQPMRLFPYHGRFFNTKYPLLARLPAHYRSVINTVELRLGPGWSAPPRCQNTSPSLGLADCTNLKVLKIFVEIDPSDATFNGFYQTRDRERKDNAIFKSYRGASATQDTYMHFCMHLLHGIFAQAPSLETVEIDAYPSVKKDGMLVMGLRRTIEEAKLRLAWGPLRGWEKDGNEPGEIGLEKAMAGMGLGGEMPRVVEVRA